MALNDISITIGGDPTGAVNALRQTSAEADRVKSAMGRMASEFSTVSTSMGRMASESTSAFSSVHSSLGEIATFMTAIAAGAGFAKIISEAVNWNLEAAKMARTMGVTSEQASIMAVALHSVGVGNDVAEGAALKLSRALSQGTEKFDRFGITVKDSNGSLLPMTVIMANVNEKLLEAHTGTERNIMAMSLYGRSWGEMQGILKLTPAAMNEARETAERLHLIVGPEGIRQAAEYKKNMREIELVTKSLAVQMGGELLSSIVVVSSALGGAGVAAASAFGKLLKEASQAAEESGVVFGATLDKIILRQKTIFSKGLLGFWSDDYKKGIAEIDKNAGEVMGVIDKKYHTVPKASAPPPAPKPTPAQSAAADTTDHYAEELRKADDTYQKYLKEHNDRLLSAEKTNRDLQLNSLKQLNEQKIIGDREYLLQKQAEQLDYDMKASATATANYVKAKALSDQREKDLQKTLQSDGTYAGDVVGRNEANAKAEAAAKAMQIANANVALLRQQIEGTGKLNIVQDERAAKELAIQKLEIQGYTSAAENAKNEIKYADIYQKTGNQELVQLARANDLLKQQEATKLRIIAAQTALASINAQSAQMEADMVGRNMNTGVVDDPYAHDLAMMKAASDAKIAQIDMEIAAEQRKYNLMYKGGNEASAQLDIIIAKEKNRALTVDKFTVDSKVLATTAYKTQLSNIANYVGTASQLFSSMAQAQDQSSRKGFESAKAFSLAAAVMSTAQAIIVALASPGNIYSNMAMAAVAGAMGAIQIAKIESTSFGGSGSVSIPSGSFSASGGGATGSGAGASVSAPYQSIHDSQSSAQLDAVAKSMDSAALAMGRAADSFLSIADLFKSSIMDMLMKAVPGKYTGLQSSTSFLSDFWESTGIKSSASSLWSALKGDVVGALKAWGQSFIDIAKGSYAVLFGGDWKTANAGITASLINGQFSVGSYTDEHKSGGLFTRSQDRTIYGDNVDPVFKKGMEDLFNGLKTDILTGVASFGISAQTTKAGFAGAAVMDKIKVSTSGRTSADIEKDWEAQVQAASDAMVKTIPGLEKFSLGGELATTTLQRLSSAMMNVNDSLALVGAASIKSTGAISDSAYQLQLLMGGAEAFTKSIDSYFTSMFTDTQQKAMKSAQADRQVSSVFLEMGLAIPATRTAFISMVNALDVSTESGAQTFAALMGVAEAFGTVQDQSDATAKTLKTFNDDMGKRELALTGSSTTLYELQITQMDEMKQAVIDGMDVKRLQIIQDGEWAAAVKAASGVVSKSLTDIATAAKTAVTDMIAAQISILNAMNTIKSGPLSGSSPETLYLQAQAKFASLRGKDDLASLQALPAAADALLNASKTYNASGSAYQNDLANVLNEMARATGITDTTATAIDSQITLLGQIKSAIEAGATDTVMQLTNTLGANSVLAKLIGTWNDSTRASLAAEQAAAAEQDRLRTEAQAAAAAKAAADAAAVAQAKIDVMNNQMNAYANTQTSITGTNAGFTNQGYASSTPIANIMAMTAGAIPYDMKYDINKDGALNQADIYMWAQLAEGKIKWSDLGIPAFASGTPSVPYDMLANIHQGEIVMDRTSSDVLRKYGIPVAGSADSSTQLNAVVAELKAVRLELAEIKRHTGAGVVVAQSVGSTLIEQGSAQNKSSEMIANKTTLARMAG